MEMKALAQKIDPAQLATTVRELLFPKLELLLVYSYDITEGMCQAWLGMIIETIVKRGGLSETGATISRASFCSLANIPHLWERVNTIRATEFFLALNTRNCLSGESTRARLCALKSKNIGEIQEVLKSLDSTTH